MKKCFTINHLRTAPEFAQYRRLFEKKLYQGIEIFYPYQLDLAGIDAYTNNVKSLLEEYPKIIPVLHLPHGKENDLLDTKKYDAVLMRLKSAIRYANGFGIRKATLHLGYVKGQSERESLLHFAVKTVKDLCSYADCYNMKIMIENMPRNTELGYSPEEILSIIEKVSLPNLGFIYDTGHAHISEFRDTDYLMTLGNYLEHIHYSDNSGVKDEHGRIGTGTIDFASIYRILREIGYQGLHCSEVIYRNPDELEGFAKDMDNDILP